ncbi:hypothetical protein QVM55_26695 [Pseudomonas monteilii]|uniref:hypothetical protein n=1 Tax=Pseudomonas monteilii TaxID=76759 RepID=UPI003525C2EB
MGPKNRECWSGFNVRRFLMCWLLDSRKISGYFRPSLSLGYVINAVRNTASDISHAETLFKDLSIRIEFILDAISDRSEVVAQMVARMKNKVYELGVLTQFWETRLQRYEQMGVVF